ncbi:hypothetical protein B0J12DRAFT_692224 [Macrophomina phaseolina]|uniref:Fungal N-terminal domain-containing protein n=1 Tax=Macrophomina phaseolina TaxID=35725 RepID=A0ABQ8FPK8_9PEZI|nr:hypothetical protein B0J12DRAFT_692224 [Macrophomina phaseolina]
MAEAKLVLSCLSAASSVLVSGFKITQFVYELKHVDQKTQDLLIIAKAVNDTVEELQRLRDQSKRSQLLDTDADADDDDDDDDDDDVPALAFVDKKLASAREAVFSVLQLVERARVDRSVKADARSSLATRALFVIRDSPNVAEVYTKLQIAYGGLTQALVVQNAAPPPQQKQEQLQQIAAVAPPSPQQLNGLPPTYEESEYLNRGRRTRSTRKPVQMVSFAAEAVDAGERETSEPYGDQPQLQAQPTIVVELNAKPGTHALQQQNDGAMVGAESQVNGGALAPMNDQRDQGGKQISSTLSGKAREREWLAQHAVHHGF